MQKHLKVMILDKQYTVAASSDENEQDICDAAKLVDTLLKNKLEKIQTGTNLEKISLVVALQLATDLVKEQRRVVLYEDRLAELVSFVSNNAV